MKTITLLALLAISLNAFAQQWNVKAPTPTKRSQVCAAVVNNQIYIIGGSDSSKTTVSTVEAYDPLTNTWSTKTSMPTARVELVAVTVNGKIYAIGGWSNGYALNVVEEYDPATNLWTTKAPMPTARAQISGAVINNKIYVVGGWVAYYTTLEEYDPATDSWTTKSPVSIGREQDNSCAVFNNKMYYMGGKTGPTNMLNINEAYDPTTNTWTSKANIPHPLFAGSLTTFIDNKIHYLGGADTSWLGNPQCFGQYNTNYEYDPATDTWNTGLPMLHGRAMHASATVNGKLYVIGGLDSIGNFVNWNEEYSLGICYTYITVTDTLIINANLTGLSPVTYANSIKIFPSPTNDHITIDYGNYLSLNGYSLKITNSLSQTVFQTAINKTSDYLNLNSWTGKGIYFVYLIDSNSNIVDIRKIILQ